jgi:hypothetical protein
MKRALLTITPLVVTVALALSVFLSPRSASAGPVAWSDSLAEYGMPATPQMWQPSNWDVQIHARDDFDVGNDAHLADHGTDCAAPPAQHQSVGWQQAVFACHEHVMTSSINEGYGEIVLTPDHMADWSSGPVTVSWSMSTWRTDGRDWVSISVTPFANLLSVPSNVSPVDLNGMPRRYVQLESGGFNNLTQWKVEQGYPDFAGGTLQEEWPTFNEQTGIQDSKTVRTPFEFTFDKHSYVFRVAPSSPVGGGKVILSGTWARDLDYTQGVVQFAQHAYNPDKCSEGPMADQNFCSANTWHWSDFGISSAVPYTLLRPTDHQVVTQPGGAVSFAQGAPQNAFLKFMARGVVEVSYDNGATYQKAATADQDPQFAGYEANWRNFMTPVPPGVRQVRLRLTGGWYGQGFARDFSIVSQQSSGGQNGTPPPSPTDTPQPTPTNTPVPATPTPSPIPSVSPSPTPQNYDGPCTVLLNDQPVSGVCHGTFTPLP